MGLRGPQKKPSVVHLLNGNPSKKPINELIDGVQPRVSIPKCPSHLKPEAKKEWKRVAPILEELGLISDMYRAKLAVYCQAWAKWVEAENKINALGDEGLVFKTPSGYEQISPWQSISNRAVEIMDKAGGSFGFDPSSITRVSPGAVNTDMFEEFGDDAPKVPGRFFN